MIKYYVSVIDGPRYGLLLGPYDNHEQALALVDAGRDLACKADRKAWFYAYGTASIDTSKLANGVLLPVGKLNHLLDKDTNNDNSSNV